jgi:LssY C-terminus
MHSLRAAIGFRIKVAISGRYGRKRFGKSCKQAKRGALRGRSSESSNVEFTHDSRKPSGRKLTRTYLLRTWLVLILMSFPVCAQDLPAGTTLEVRLSTPIGSRISHIGDQVEAIEIAPIYFRGQILVPQRSRVIGSIESVKRFGFGLKQVTATIRYQFHTLQLPSGNTIPIQTELLEVETAKERVDVDGTVRGIHPAASLSSSLSLVTVPMLFAVPTLGAPVWGIKSVIAPSANPEIYFPPGTELILRLTAPIEVSSSGEEPVGITLFSPDEVSEVHRLLKGSAQQARQQGTHPSDVVNVLFLGSREELDRAFYAAGWSQADGKSPLSLYRMYDALTKRVGYRRAPMNTLTLNGVLPDFVYQKNLDTVQKRHHVRLWREPHRANVWLGAAAEDIAFRFQLMHWTHSTAPNIDVERAKVVNDLAFTGCLDAAGLVPRDSSELLRHPKGAHLILTDTDIAVVRLNSCHNPNTMPGVDATSTMNSHGRLSGELASLRNDLRLNVFFTTYNTVKFLVERRTFKSLRKAPSSDINPPGLGWLGSPTRGQSYPQAICETLPEGDCFPARRNRAWSVTRARIR